MTDEELSKLKTQAIEEAYRKLGPTDKAIIDEMVDDIHKRLPKKSMMGPQSSIELLGKLGMLFAERGLTPRSSRRRNGRGVDGAE